MERRNTDGVGLSSICKGSASAGLCLTTSGRADDKRFLLVRASDFLFGGKKKDLKAKKMGIFVDKSALLQALVGFRRGTASLISWEMSTWRLLNSFNFFFFLSLLVD